MDGIQSAVLPYLIAALIYGGTLLTATLLRRPDGPRPERHKAEENTHE